MTKSKLAVEIVIVLAFIELIVILVGFAKPLGLIFPSILLGGVILLFYKLTIRIDGKLFRVVYGVGLIRFSIPISAIHSVRVVKNRNWAGWGIRFIPGYTIHNVGGDHAIELSFKNKRRKMLISIDHPHQVKQFLIMALELN